MIVFTPKLWKGLGAALAVGSVATLGACGGEGGEKAGGEGGEAAIGETGQEGGAPPPPPVSTAGEAGGEAGAATAYARLTQEQETALRLQHLKGFLLVAQKEAQAQRGEEGGAIIAQGVLEAYDPAPASFGGLDVAPIKAAADAFMDKKPDAGAKLDAALAAIGAAQKPGEAETVRRMLRIATGIYGEAVRPEGVDPTEYAHAFGAALSAQDSLRRAEAALSKANPGRFAEANTEMARFVGLFGALDGSAAKPAAQALAQASRVELALSGL